MSEILRNPINVEPIGFLNETPSKSCMAAYMLFGGNESTYNLLASYWTSSKDSASRGFRQYELPIDEVPKTIFLIEFDPLIYPNRDEKENTPIDTYSVFKRLKDKEFSILSEQFHKFCENKIPNNIDLFFTTKDNDTKLVTDVVSALNMGNTYLDVVRDSSSSDIYRGVLLNPNLINAFVLNN